MCGFAGGFNEFTPSRELNSDVRKMLGAIVNRGPDDSGVWQEGEMALGHQRLSIIDLSPTGHQPMASHCGRYVIAYNGEVYNFNDIKAALISERRLSFNGHSDTEVLIEAISAWGIEATLPKLNGMFAFAVWDRQTKTVTLCRDRFGEKPLYYYADNGRFYFASEVKCLEQVSELTLELDHSAMSLLLQYGYIAAPHSIYKKVKKVQPGTIVRFSKPGKIEHFTYWDAVSAAREAKINPYHSKEEAVEDLKQKLTTAVKLRMVSDVPLGAFLSGGIDSSTVVSLMQEQSSAPINTFSIGFNVAGYNEATYAAKVAKHLQTQHHELYVSANDALEVIPTLASMYDEPFADSSQIPTFLLSRMTREKVTVALSGDGGDELFCGYNRYDAVVAMWSKLGRLPSRKSIAFLIRHAPVKVLETMFFFLRGYAEKYSRKGALGPKVRRFADWLVAQSIDELYYLTMRHWNATQILGESMVADTEAYPNLDTFEGFEALERMMLFDTTDYLPGDILTKVDRATMAVSLEGRIPMLDPNVFESAWRMPLSMRTFNGEGKWPLKQVLAQYVPSEYFERPKRGFAMPIGNWLRKDLKDWAHELLDPGKLDAQGIVNSKVVTKVFNEHLTGYANHSEKLWNILMLQAWLKARGH